MVSHPDIADEARKRKTQSWYPGGRVRPGRATPRGAHAAYSIERTGFASQADFWAPSDTADDFEDDPGLGRALHPGRALLATLRRVLPLAVAAFVGAVTALAWQSFLAAPAKVPAAQPAMSVAAAPRDIAFPRPVNTADKPAVAVQVAAPAPAAPTPVRPVQQLSPGPAPAPATASAAAALARPPSPRPLGLRALLDKPRSPAAHPNTSRAPRPAALPARKSQSGDPDAVLMPAFM
jgi:hypothetical protein